MEAQFPQVTVVGTEQEVMDFLEEYVDGDTEHALDLFEDAEPVGPGKCQVTVDWVPRYDR